MIKRSNGTDIHTSLVLTLISSCKRSASVDVAMVVPFTIVSLKAGTEETTKTCKSHAIRQGYYLQDHPITPRLLGIKVILTHI